MQPQESGSQFMAMCQPPEANPGTIVLVDWYCPPALLHWPSQAGVNGERAERGRSVVWGGGHACRFRKVVVPGSCT